MHISLVLLFFVRYALCDDQYTTPAAGTSLSEVYANVGMGSARQLLGSSLVRNVAGVQQQELRSAGSRNPQEQPQIQKQQQHADYFDEDLNPSDYPPLEHPESDEYDYSDHDIPNQAHAIFTTEPLQPDAHARGIGSTVGTVGRSRFRDIGARSGGRTDLYEVREFGDRGLGITRGREKYMQVWHNKEKVFVPPKMAVVHEDSFPLSPNDGTLHECVNDCNQFQWQCLTSCSCIDHSARCDKEPQCEDGSDEFDCDALGDMMTKRQKECEQMGTHIMCPKTYRCIHKEWLCDGDDDCGDYSDETHCGAQSNCTEDQFECQNGFCIQNKWVCDGENDCKDFSDEANCSKITCSPDHFTCRSGYCVSLSFRCDGDSDCPDDDDEQECQRVTNSCPEGEFKCRGGLGGSGGPGGHCVLNRFRCDGDNDCGDWSDEENCSKKPIKCSSSEYQCSDGECIPKRWQCDKEQDCDGGEDEKVCGNMNHSQPASCGPDEYTCINGRCILRTWLCDGYPDCSSAEDEVDCHLQCDPGQFLCPAKKNITNLKICVHQKHICDGQYDCPLGEDEMNCPHDRICGKDSQCEQLCITSARGQPECACRLGYLMHENRQNCTDIDECQYLSNPVCSQKCINTAGSFTCSCEVGYILRPDLRTCKALGGAMQLLVANRWDIRRVFLSNNRYNAIVKGLHNAIALDFHYLKGLLFWSDVATDVIKMAHVNGTRVRNVIKWGLESPGGLAVDWVHDLLFWTDSGTRRVEVSNFQGNLRVVLAANDLDKPRAIVAHPGEASIFWSDWGPNPKIERAYMDGSERRMIIGSGVTWPNGLTIDYPSHKLYWADAKQHAIECSNFDGSGRVKILSTHLPHPFALTIFEDTMYWTDWNTKTVSAANKITGKGFRSVHENFHFPMDVHAYHPARQPEYEDRCPKDRRGFRGGCSHLCLPSKNSRHCGCPIGLTLKEDRKTCSSVPDNLVLVARHKDIRILQLNSRSSSATNDIDMIIPLDNLKHAVALDWCSETDFIYWSDVERSSINKAHLNGSSQQKVIHTNLVSPAGLAVDWVTGKLYWTDWGTNRIEVATSDGKMRSTLIWENIEKPRDIVVNPIDGIMFWSNWGDEAVIERADMDGRRRIILTAKNLKWPNGLAIDYSQQKLYFVDGGLKTLENMNFDGSSRRLILNSGLGHPFGLDISNNHVYWTDWVTNSAHSANKLTGQDITTLIRNTSNLMDIRVFHRSRRRAHNACRNLNGGCSHLCLLNQGSYSCACPIGVQLKNDQHNCSDGPSNYILFAHRFDIRQISLDFDHLIDVVLPLPPISNAVALDVDQQTGIIYWADTTENVIMSSTHDGLNVHQIIGENLEHTEGLVVDSVGRNIYWTDSGRHTIEVATLDGKCRHVIAWKDLDSPRALALDYEAGYMFWTDWGINRKIDRADMDGENREHIITSKLGWPNGLTVDLKAKRIYWIDAQLKTIDSCDYTGNKRQMIMSSLHHPYALALTDDYIYWTDWKSKALHRAERRNISAKIDVIQNIEGLMDIKVVMTNVTLANNVCGNNNGGCSHLCLRNPTGYSCKCPIGLKLKEGSSTQCQTLPDDFLLIAMRSGIGMISLNTVDFMDVVLPISGVHGAVVLDFHYRKNLLFFADVNLDIIRRVNLLNCSDSKTIVKTDLLTPNGICIDWLADNIFWSDTERKVIEVARLDGSSRKQLITEDLIDPRSMIIYPKKGYLFWADWGAPRIERSSLDGSNRTHVVTEKLGYPTGLTIDFEKRRLLWTDALDDCINQVDFNGNRRANIIMYAPHPFGLTMFGKTYYWTNWYNKTVYHAYPTNLGLKEAPARRSLIGALDIRAVSSTRQPQDWNQCVQENGGCTHLCLYRGFDYVCACPDKPDGRECRISPQVVVPRRSDDTAAEYGDDSSGNNNNGNSDSTINDDSDYLSDDTVSRKTFIIVASSVVTVMLILILVAVLLLMFNSKRNKTKRGGHSRGSSRSVLTFSNPNYNVGDTPMEPKTNIWKRFKVDRTQQERVYEERSLTTETASSSLFVPTPSPMASPSTKNNASPSLATIA